MAIELGKAYVQIIPSAQGISGSITEALGGEAKSAGKTAGLNIVSSLKGIIATAGIGTAIKSALDAGGALQQSYGGLDTIYGEAGEAAKKYAAEAAAAGISANSYAEQAVSFGASLKQAFSGDTTKAVEAANTAILDMADNSAKMGTDITAIQTAYQGFAKQNYTMLDNLKLGYGGTKTEMERLLADATKLSGVEYDISNLGDVYEAIHVIQQDLGLTGVAAAEAEGTFTGSMGAMKAAAQNLMANLALGEDITTPLKVLLGNAQAFLINNMLPMIGNVLKGIPTLINEFATNMLPELIEQAGTFLGELGANLSTQIPEMLANILPGILEFVTNLRASAGNLVDVGIEFLKNLVQGIANALPTLIAYIPQIVTNIAGIINDNAPKLLAAGWDMLLTLAKGIIDAVPALIENFPAIIEAILAVWRAVNWMQVGIDIINLISNGLRALFTAIPELLKSIATNAMTLFKNVDWLGVGKSILLFIGKGILVTISVLGGYIADVIASIITKFVNTDWKSIGVNILKGIANGILGGISYVVDAAKEAANSAFNAAKDFLGISSPAKKGIYIGEMLDEGFALGISDNSGIVDDAITNLSKSATAELTTPNVNGYQSLATNDTSSLDSVIALLGAYLPQIAAGESVNISLEGDAEGLFNVMRKQNKIYRRMNGESAFA